ncbi:efflux transporter outer membrane subunit [Tsuneonella amylolytica]|uniref:efflux transporter outer membrane subunit n=1 Tax=Tsuneonella amylolytica TaxID=2338327 RepID=UPI000EA872EF|nr:efflux transporter outer membrane subunit [Tsuneonella amylolytica]
MIARVLISGTAALSLAACSVAPPVAGPPPPPVPLSWPVGDAYLAQSEAALPIVSYTQVFTDPRLQQLVATALIENRDLRVAAANLAAARAQVRVTRSAQFPQVGVNGSVDVSRGSTAGSGTNTGSGNGSGTRTSYSVQGGVSSYELDLFGRYANATEADRERALATEAFARTVRLGIVADIASAWATYAADRDLLAIAEQTAANARESVRLTDLRLKGGIAPRTDLAQAQQVLASAEIAIGEQKTALAQDRNLLRLLVGTEFDAALLPNSIEEIGPTFATLPAGLDSSVLLRRPDVIEAEYRLRAAGADIAVARAALFPSLSLTGLLGLASTALTDLFTGGAFRLSAGAGVGYSIFDAGGRRARVEVTEAQRDAALSSYEGTIQTAFREVSDALADQGTLGERARDARDNAAAATTSVRLSDARYRNGVDSFLDSLIAQRNAFAARQQLVRIELTTLLNRIAVYRALGGDQLGVDPEAPAG